MICCYIAKHLFNSCAFFSAFYPKVETVNQTQIILWKEEKRDTNNVGIRG